MCTVEHNVVHGATSPGSWEDRLQMMVMLRSDLFHDSAHPSPSKPIPSEDTMHPTELSVVYVKDLIEDEDENGRTLKVAGPWK